MISRQILEALEEEQKRLDTVIRKAERELERAPEGSVLVKRYKKGVQFYFRTVASDRNGKYIPVAERKRAIALVQKAYNKRALAAASKQRNAISAFLRSYDPQALREIYQREGKLRQPYLRPFELPDAQYAEAWQGMVYESKAFREDVSVHYTERGERVRSKSEVMIANALARAGIPYRYECPLNFDGRIIHPDFTILRMRDRKEVYWEHLGMMDDAEYRHHAFMRIRTYESSGIFQGERLILTIETGRLPLNSVLIQRTIEQYLL